MNEPRRTVLVIEDDLRGRAALLRILGPRYEVSLADNGEAALELIDQGQRFDVILSDVCMPRMDGATFVEQLRQRDADQAARVIVLTANPNSASACRLSAHYFLIEKPYDIPTLRDLVDKVSAAARDGYFPSRSARRAI